MRILRLYLDLIKAPLSFMIGFSGIFGFAMHTGHPAASLFLAGAGIFLLACGGSCLNNVQDREIDRLFSRTRNRPLPSGRISPARALSLSVLLILIGIGTLFLIRRNFILPMMGATAILLYNGVYTPLKPRTLLAIIPGALCGAMPPMIGWTAAGGTLFSLEIVSIMILFAIWQLPHFWLILLKNGAEYQTSRLPNMLKHFDRFQLEKIVFIWIANFGVMLLCIPMLYWGNQTLTAGILAVTALVLVSATFFSIFLRGGQENFKPVFRFLNGTFFFAMVVVLMERLG